MNPLELFSSQFPALNKNPSLFGIRNVITNSEIRINYQGKNDSVKLPDNLKGML
jgi:hypothetical protein